MIQGFNDTWFTIEEFAAMIGRAPKTILNWASDGKIQFASLYGVNLVSMRLLEALLAGTTPPEGSSERLALERMGRMTPDGTREVLQQRKRRSDCLSPTLGPDRAQPEDRTGIESQPCAR